MGKEDLCEILVPPGPKTGEAELVSHNIVELIGVSATELMNPL